MSMAVIEERLNSAASGGDEQVEVPIAVDISKDGTSTKPIRADYAGIRGHIPELQPAYVFRQCVAAGKTAKKDIRQAVIVKISHRDSGSVKEDAISFAGVLIQCVGKIDSGLFRRQELEAGVAR